MNDSELSAAIAEAVRGVWADRCIAVGRHRLVYIPHESAWQMMCGDDDATWVPERWAAAILMHELERMQWPLNETGERERCAARAARDKLKELLRAQA